MASNVVDLVGAGMHPVLQTIDNLQQMYQPIAMSSQDYVQSKKHSEIPNMPQKLVDAEQLETNKIAKEGAEESVRWVEPFSTLDRI